MTDTYKFFTQTTKKYLPGILLFSAALSFLTYAIVEKSGPTYEVYYSYLISIKERDKTEDYRFDGYYAINSTDLFASTLAAWSQTPEIIVKAHHEAGVKLPGHRPAQLTKIVNTDKTGPQIIQVTIKHKNLDSAEKLAQGLKKAVEQNIAKYHREGNPDLTFSVTTTEPWTGQTSLSAATITIGVFVFAVLLGMNAILLLESMKNSKSKKDDETLC